MRIFCEYFSILLISFSYTFLIRNHLYFGIALGTGSLTLLLLNLKYLKHKFTFKQIYPFLIFMSALAISSANSIIINRSFPVVIYLFLIVTFSYLLFKYLRNNKNIRDKLINFFVVSIFLNLLIVSVYNLIYMDYSNPFSHEVKRFKGYLNILTILVIILPFLKKTKINIIAYLLILPNLLISNCNSAILGILFSLLGLLIFFVYQHFLKTKIFILSVFLISLISSLLVINKLPREFDKTSIQNSSMKIPTEIIDTHRQYIWGFSLNKFFDKPLLGYGPDTSNFIDGSQEIIGSKNTGTMPYIPSHPHNFIIEILLDTGLIGLLSFAIFNLIYFFRIFNNLNSKGKYLLVCFMFYFWGASLVNFSYWNGWWQTSFFFLISIISSFSLSGAKKNN
jgi:O-antigen ligase